MRRGFKQLIGGAGVSALLLLGVATPAVAAQHSMGAWSCPASVPPLSGNKIYTTSKTTGDTSHNVWTSASNNQGQWWPGTSAWQNRTFYSTKSSANQTWFTYTQYTQTGKHCYT